MKKFFLYAIPLLLVTGCAQLHHVQVGDIDAPPGRSLEPVEIMVSETGVNLKEAADIAAAFTRNNKTQQQIKDLQAIISLFQMGPVTGNPVYVENYTQTLPEIMKAKCPSGHLTALTSIRETRKYPVISGEIVKIRGFCVLN